MVFDELPNCPAGELIVELDGLLAEAIPELLVESYILLGTVLVTKLLELIENDVVVLSP